MRSRRRLPASVLAGFCAGLLSIGLLAPGGAGAATIVNGDFETGTLSGWTVQASPSGELDDGTWYAYSGTTSPYEAEFAGPVPPPPAGTYAAITAQGGPGARFLYQDVALEPYYAHQLSMSVYYQSDAPLVTPNPNALELPEGEIMLLEPVPNQQYRIDVVKPTAPIASLAPGDVLATVFATNTGDPQVRPAATFTADLTAFAGQTVRLRLAEVDNEGVFNAGADSVAIQSTAPSNAITVGKKKLNKKRGTVKLTVTVPGAGVLTASKKKRIKAVMKTVTAAGTVKLNLKPTSPALKKLEVKGKLKVKVAVGFTPTGGLLATKKVTVVLKKSP